MKTLVERIKQTAIEQFNLDEHNCLFIERRVNNSGRMYFFLFISYFREENNFQYYEFSSGRTLLHLLENVKNCYPCSKRNYNNGRHYTWRSPLQGRPILPEGELVKMPTLYPARRTDRVFKKPKRLYL